MKTIEERAKEYAKKEGSISLSETYNQCLAEIYEMAYIAGANEQKAIDDNRYIESLSKILKSIKKDTIDDACEWLSDYFVFKHEAMSAQGCDAFLRAFRKAMGDKYVE